MDNSHSASHHAGEAKGKLQEKSHQVMDKADHAAQSVKDSCHEAGHQMQAKAQGAVDAVKNATHHKQWKAFKTHYCYTYTKTLTN